jgi:tetratricopeptide (TPR) repeat protein
MGAIGGERWRHYWSRAAVSCLDELRSRGCGATVQSCEPVLGYYRKIEAEAAMRAATRVDTTSAEAWYNLSDLLDELCRSEAAIDCLRRALQVAPGHADAMFNLALRLQRASQHKEAGECWRQYLANDAQSEWAARARRSLKFCEMQIHLSAS